MFTDLLFIVLHISLVVSPPDRAVILLPPVFFLGGVQ